MNAPLPLKPGCVKCARLRAAEEAARARLDPSGAVDYRVLARRHLQVAHSVTVVAR